MRKPYPLQWPAGWPRTADDQRQRSRFGVWGPGGGRQNVPLSHAVQDVVREMERLQARNAVITSDLPTRADGLPYASGRAQDPGIAVYWTGDDGAERVIACDQYFTHAENLRAIAKSIEALRALERYGSTSIIQRAWSGFAALPPPAEAVEEKPDPEPSREWMEYFHVTEAASSETLRQTYRSMAKRMHPDHGGDVAEFQQLDAAWRQAQAWFAWRERRLGR